MDINHVPRELPLDGFAFSPDSLQGLFLSPVGSLVALTVSVTRSASGTEARSTQFITAPLRTLVDTLLSSVPSAIEIPIDDDAVGLAHVEVWPCQELLLIDTGTLEVVFDVNLIQFSSIAREAIETIIKTSILLARNSIDNPDELTFRVDVRTAIEAFVLVESRLSDYEMVAARVLGFGAAEVAPGATYVDGTDEEENFASEMVLVSRTGDSDDVASTILRDTSRLMGVQPHRTMPIFYATNRARVPTNETVVFGTDRGREITYGVCRVAIPASHRRGGREHPFWPRFFNEWRSNAHEHLMIVTNAILEEERFFSSLRSAVQNANRDDILVFVHGFRTGFSDAVRRAAQLAEDIRFPGTTAVFSWPSMDFAYRRAKENAEWSILALEEFLGNLRALSGSGEIHIVAHSMGNQPVIHALSRLALAERATFSEIVMAAPDMDVDTLREHARAIRKIASRLTLYSSAKDWALFIAKLLHGQTRAGGEFHQYADVFDPIDASSLAELLSLNHEYTAENTWALVELEELLGRHLPASQRIALRPHVDGGWTFRDDL